MTTDKIKKILPDVIYNHWMECRDIEKMKSAIKELTWMLDNRKELMLGDELIRRYYAERELLMSRTGTFSY